MMGAQVVRNLINSRELCRLKLKPFYVVYDDDPVHSLESCYRKVPIQCRHIKQWLLRSFFISHLSWEVEICPSTKYFYDDCLLCLS